MAEGEADVVAEEDGDGEGDGEGEVPESVGASVGVELVSTNTEPAKTPLVSAVEPPAGVVTDPATPWFNVTSVMSTSLPSPVCNSLSTLITSSYAPTTDKETGIA